MQGSSGPSGGSSSTVEISEVFGTEKSSKCDVCWAIPVPAHFPDAYREKILGYRVIDGEVVSGVKGSGASIEMNDLDRHHHHHGLGSADSPLHGGGGPLNERDGSLHGGAGHDSELASLASNFDRDSGIPDDIHDYDEDLEETREDGDVSGVEVSYSRRSIVFNIDENTEDLVSVIFF
jgi:hypothetical protein